jgi:shikimate kinase
VEASRILALVGLRGSGKTTLGRALATRLDLPLVDLDDELWRHAGGTHRAAGALLRELGEPAFREIEARALAQVLARPGPFVLATGGGTVERAENRARLAARCRCAWLQAPLSELAARIAADAAERPRLGAGSLEEELAQVEVRRRPWFRELAEAQIATTGESALALRALLRWARGVEGDGGSG